MPITKVATMSEHPTIEIPRKTTQALGSQAIISDVHGSLIFSGCPDQQIGRPFILKGLTTGTTPYFIPLWVH